MEIRLAEPCLVLLVGPSGSGKSTFARRHFRATEVLSSDYCRALVSDDENDQTATSDAFELLHLILRMRLMRKRTTAVDATNVQAASRASLIMVAKTCDVPAIAIVFSLPEDVCQTRNQQRPYRQVPAAVIRQQLQNLAESLDEIAEEGFNLVYKLMNEAEAESATLVRLHS